MKADSSSSPRSMSPDSFLESVFEALHFISGSALKIRKIVPEVFETIQECFDTLFQLVQEFKQYCIKVIS